MSTFDNRLFSRDSSRYNRGRTNRPSQRPCRLFKEGRCSYGATCRFSHNAASIEERPTHFLRDNRLPNFDSPERYQEVALQNRVLRRLKIPPIDRSEIEQLWSDVLTILNTGEREFQQKVVKAFASDEDGAYGLEHVREVINTQPSQYTYDEFVNLMCPFLKSITHPEVLRCLSIDVEVGDLYNYISGSGGTRGIPFFHGVVDTLSDKAGSFHMPSIFATQFAHTIVALVTAIREMLQRCPKALLHEDAPALGAHLSNLLNLIGDETSSHSNTIASQISEVNGMIQRAQGILLKEDENVEGWTTQHISAVVSTYPQAIELPGDRHDNDKMDIAQIAIIPTEAEIRSERPEFLPSPLPSKPHFLQGKERHLDTHFRLHRHDIFGELKSIINDFLNLPTDEKQRKEMIQLSQNNNNTFVYVGAGVAHINSTRKCGIEAQIAFQLPLNLRKKSLAQRQQWWNATKRLEEGSMICLISFQDGEGTPLFFTVTEKNTQPKAEFGLVSENLPAISAKLSSGITTRQLRSLIINFKKTNGLLVEVPGIIPATFMPVLENLQRMQKDSRLPFANWILEQTGSTSALEVPPPSYTRIPGFSFDLSSILSDATQSLALHPGSGTENIQRMLEERTTLDQGQCEALITALSREFALIQGPPGTGKSYVGVQLMRVLLANKVKASLGPIIVVCYTNHALDQFLEHLLDVGVEKMIRIGGNSSSKLLEGKNLRVISKFEQGKTSIESRTLGQAFGDKNINENVLQHQLGKLHAIQDHSWNSIESHLMRKYREIHQQFSLIDADGFKKVSKVAPFDLWKTGRGENLAKLNRPCVTQNIITILAAANKNVYTLALKDRGALLKHWATEIMEDIINSVAGTIDGIDIAQKTIDLIHGEVDRRLLETADVIGVTTTGLAKNILVLRSTNAKVAICEEAGEVLEAHMLSALIPSVQHLIQIGDHEQLRPQISNFGLFSLESDQGKLYQLDRSLFERLAVRRPGKPSFPLAQLNVQRRMRPEISKFVRNTLYHKLKDHPETYNLPDVVGMRKNVFWYHHTNPEDGGQDDSRGKSHSNDLEVDMTLALVQHIVRQGVYKSNDIAVLTPYAGQLRKLQSKLSSSFEVVLSERDQDELAKSGVDDLILGLWDSIVPTPKKDAKQAIERKSIKELIRIATVDNFQGEEAKIIIISLVRSNKLKKAGFLRTTNRINVLLSRAQHGMYVIGNSDTYSLVPMWSKVLDMFRETESFGEEFSLCCPRHPELDILVSKPEHFELLSPEGGCNKACDR
jgi:AAA domain/Zinc finger C-x8-C-x5-C-x3-H type (and similar)